MADNQTTNPDQGAPIESPVRTATDLELEKLTARLDALESENKELRNANQGLWAQLHPVQDTRQTVSEMPQTVVMPSGDGDYKVLAEKIGLKEE